MKGVVINNIKLSFINWEAIKNLSFKKERAFLCSLTVMQVIGLGGCGRGNDDVEKEEYSVFMCLKIINVLILIKVVEIILWLF